MSFLNVLMNSMTPKVHTLTPYGHNQYIGELYSWVQVGGRNRSIQTLTAVSAYFASCEEWNELPECIHEQHDPECIATMHIAHPHIFHTTTLSHITPQHNKNTLPLVTIHTHNHYTSTVPLLHTLAHSVCPTSLNSSLSRTPSPLMSALSKKSPMVSSNTSSYTSAGVGQTESQGCIASPTQHSS